jgi:hypothetical protein
MVNSLNAEGVAGRTASWLVPGNRSTPPETTQRRA